MTIIVDTHINRVTNDINKFKRDSTTYIKIMHHDNGFHSFNGIHYWYICRVRYL